MATTSTPSVFEPTRPYFSPHRKAKAKRPNRKKNWHLVIQVTYRSLQFYSEKTRLKKLMIMIIIIFIIIIMNKSQELTVFHWRQKLTSAKNKRPEK